METENLEAKAFRWLCKLVLQQKACLADLGDLQEKVRRKLFQLGLKETEL